MQIRWPPLLALVGVALAALTWRATRRSAGVTEPSAKDIHVPPPPRDAYGH